MKRFTDTCKWDDPWFRELRGAWKLVFLYVIDRCNNAGFWEVDEAAITWHTKLTSEQVKGALEGLERGLKGADGWVWVKNFLKHQKNDALNPSNPAHRQIIQLIREQSSRFSQCSAFTDFEGAVKGLERPIGQVQVKEKVEKGVQREEANADSDPPGMAPTREKWVSMLELFSIPEWYALKKYDVWDAKGWCIGRTLAHWSKMGSMMKKDYVNDGSPASEAQLYRPNGAPPKPDPLKNIKMV